MKSEKSKKLVKDIVSKYISEKPRKISLRLDWNKKSSEVSIVGDSKQSIEYDRTIDFTSFAHGVLDAYREAYGEMEVVPISFREEIYKNDNVALDLYPTGSAGVFDIFVGYKQKFRK
jgi:hypothetical protein